MCNRLHISWRDSYLGRPAAWDKKAESISGMQSGSKPGWLLVVLRSGSLLGPLLGRWRASRAIIGNLWSSALRTSHEAAKTLSRTPSPPASSPARRSPSGPRRMARPAQPRGPSDSLNAWLSGESWSLLQHWCHDTVSTIPKRDEGAIRACLVMPGRLHAGQRSRAGRPRTASASDAAGSMAWPPSTARG